MSDEKAMQEKLQELLNRNKERPRRDPEVMKKEMIDQINAGGAWFTIRSNNHLKIGYSETDNCLFARECVVKEADGDDAAAGKTLAGGAYSFSTDWFDINFHGRRIDIYCDPETFKSWDIVYIPGKGTYFEGGEERVGMAKRVLDFCKVADSEALEGNLRGFSIDGAAFAKVIALSE